MNRRCFLEAAAAFLACGMAPQAAPIRPAVTAIKPAKGYWCYIIPRLGPVGWRPPHGTFIATE